MFSRIVILTLAAAFVACQGPLRLADAVTTLPASPSPVALGFWEFYPDEFCGGADCSGEPIAAPAPLAWTKGAHPRMPGNGFGTYVTTLALPAGWRDSRLAVQFFNVNTAYRMLVDGEVIDGGGTVARSPDGFVARLVPYIVPFRSGAGERIQIAVHVANYAHPYGGLRKAPVLGPERELSRLRDLRLLRDLVLLGIILGMAFYHFALFLSRRDDRPALIFSLFCFVYAVRMIFTGETMALLIYPELTYRVQLSVEFLTLIAGAPIFAFFLAVTYPRSWVRPVLIGYSLPGLLLAAFVVVAPPLVYIPYLALFQLYAVVSILLCTTILVVAIRGGKIGAWASLVGGIVVALAVVNDVLYHQRISPVGPIFVYGFFFFILAQSYLLARLFAAAYESVRRLSDSLTRTNSALSRFVPTQFLDFLNRQDITEIHLGDQIRQRMGILFCDIRSFTTLSEKMTPEENFNFLNSYLKRIAPVVNRHGGFVDKFIGDAVMALFPGDADTALAAAVDMQRELMLYNKHRATKNYDPINIGIGVHIGELMLGIIGHENRMEGTVISDTVNTAARLEGLTRRYGASIIVSDTFREALGHPERFHLRRLGQVQVKGKTTTITIHQVLDGYPPERMERYLATRDRFHQAVDLAYAKEFTAAEKIFAELSTEDPEDGAIDFYLTQIEKALGGAS